MSTKPLFLIKCMPASLNQTPPPSSVLQTLHHSLTQANLLPRDAPFEQFTANLYRLILAPCQLALSIAEALLDATKEVFIDPSVLDPSDLAVHPVDTEQWLKDHGHFPKLKDYWGRDSLDYSFNIRPGSFVVAIVTTLFVDRVPEVSTVCNGNGFTWPSLTSPLVHNYTEVGSASNGSTDGSEEDWEGGYLGDDLAARVQVRLVKEAKKIVERGMQERVVDHRAGDGGQTLLLDVKYQLSQFPDLPRFAILTVDGGDNLQGILQQYSSVTEQLLSTLDGFKSRLVNP